MRVALLGPPGSGKGTQAKQVADRHQVPHISTGDILRGAVRDETELGKKAAPIMATGALVPDELMIGIIQERLNQDDASRGFVLDGFPRTVHQAEKLDRLIEGNGSEGLKVLVLSVPDDVIVRRLGGRRSCPDCGASYHIEHSPPAKPGVCDRCGGPVVERKDDSEDAIRTRLEEFRKQTMPVVGYYRDKTAVSEVDGVGSVDEIFERIDESLR